jgi:hypothetical protein
MTIEIPLKMGRGLPSIMSETIIERNAKRPLVDKRTIKIQKNLEVNALNSDQESSQPYLKPMNKA